MADASNALLKFTNATETVRDFERENDTVFGMHRRLGMAVIDARNELDDAVAESGTALENHKFRVTVTPQTMTTYDEAKILAKLGITREQAVAEGYIKEQVRPARITVSEKRDA